MAGLSPQRERDIIEAYNAWDPRTSSTGELLAGLGVTKSTLYNVLSRNGVPLKTRGGAARSTLARDEVAGMLDRMADRALDDLFRRLREEQEYTARLEAAILAHPKCRESTELRAVLRG